MLQQLIHILLISCFCCIWGMPLLLVSAKSLAKEHSWYRSLIGLFSFLFLSGCLTLSILASWLYLIIPLKFIYLLLLTLILSGVLGLFCREKITTILVSAKEGSSRFSSEERVLVIICVILFLALSCLQTVNPDTYIYHLQLIKWASQYPATPGIANLYLRLGLGSDWFGVISWFHLPFLKNENFTYLNASLTIWFFLWLFSTWHFHYRRMQTAVSGIRGSSKILCLFYFLILLYCLYDWELFRDSANSTNYDLIVTICTFLAISFLLEGIWEPAYDKQFSLLFIIIALAAIAFKFSGIFVLLMIGSYLYYHWSWRRLLFLVTGSFFILAPILIKNYIHTGYPVYPLSISPASPDWQVPKDMVDLLHNYITLTNRFYSQSFTNSYAFKKDHANWIPIWFGGILWQHRLVVLLVLSSILLLFKRRGPAAGRRRLNQLVVILLVMATGWFFTAPSPRFGYGILLCSAFLPVSIFIGPAIKPTWYRFVLWGIIGSVCLYIPGKLGILIKEPSIWLRPMPAETPPGKVIRIGGVGFLLPDRLHQDNDPRCYNADLPCICDENPYLQPRGTAIKQGFRMNPYPDSTYIQNYKY